MKNLFNSVIVQRPKSSAFDLSHDVKLSCHMGDLIPTMAEDVVPGDKFRIGCESLLRFAPLVAPMMHRVDVSMHYYFVPFRLLWDNFEKWVTNTPLTGVTLPAHPTLEINSMGGFNGAPGSLSDYLGLPEHPGGIAPSETVSALYHSAYQFIFNEYYRDQNLQAEIDYKLVDGNNSANLSLAQLQKRCWERDYFTSALPFAQKGQAVQIPVTQNFDDVVVKRDLDPAGGLTTNWNVTAPVGAGIIVENEEWDNTPDNTGQLYADTSSLNPSAPTTINDLRTANALQRWLEKMARGGSRYFEMIRSIFGTQSPDSRLQRPEYITGTKSPVQISEVLNTAGEGTPQGTMAGHGVSVTQGNYGYYRVQEHGVIMGIMSIMPKPAYQQGIARKFLKYNDPFQVYSPDFDHLGEQEIQNREVYAFQADSAETFGYIPRFAEHKFINNRVAGQFKTSLNHWHMSRIFSAPPVLNDSFVMCDPTTRVFAVTDPSDDQMWCHIYHKIRAIRPMSKYSTPSY